MKILNYIFLFAFFTVSYQVGSQVLSESDTIIFFGDSITELGERPDGFITLIRDTLVTNLGARTGGWTSGCLDLNLPKKLRICGSAVSTVL